MMYLRSSSSKETYAFTHSACLGSLCILLSTSPIHDAQNSLVLELLEDTVGIEERGILHFSDEWTRLWRL